MTHIFEVFELECVPVLFWIHFPFAVLQTHSFMLLAFLHHAIHTREASWPNPIIISHVMKNCNLFRFLGAHYIAISDDGEMTPPSVVAASQASLLSSWESLRRSPRKLDHQPNVDDALLSVKSSALKLDTVAQVMWRSLWLFTLVGKAAAATSSPLPLLLPRSRQQVHRHDVKLRPPFYV